MSLVQASVPDTFKPDPSILNSAGWKWEQGDSWANRNPKTVEELDESYQKRFGITRTEMAIRFLVNVRKRSKVLEVGTAAGRQLEVLRRIGFSDLHGCDVNESALKECAFPHKAASVLHLPYETGEFGLVFTSGTLMHVPPFQRDLAVRELLRVSSQWIWGCEAYTEEDTHITFAGLLPDAWAERWPDRFMAIEPRLKLHGKMIYSQGEGKIPYVMYLLEKPVETR